MYVYACYDVCLIIRYSGELCSATDRSESGTVEVIVTYHLKWMKTPFLGVLTVLLIEAMFGQSWRMDC